MRLARFQSEVVIYVLCSQDELALIPEPSHKTDIGANNVLVEFKNTIENQVALRLCGLDLNKRKQRYVPAAVKPRSDP